MTGKRGRGTGRPYGADKENISMALSPENQRWIDVLPVRAAQRSGPAPVSSFPVRFRVRG